MGGSISSLGRNPNPDEVKNILNVILREMFQRADLVDLYSLADPDRCSKYIVVAADALNELFLSINLEPKMGKKGEIFFQKIEGIQKANPMGAKQPNLCKFLAFFFIRIFQVYAALTLSVIDSETPREEPLIAEKDLPKGRRGLVILPIPALKGFTQPKQRGFFSGGGQMGGALIVGAFPGVGSGSYYLDPDRAGVYKILNKFLLVPSDRQEASEDDMRFQDADLQISQGSLYDFPDPANRLSRIVKDFSSRDTVRPTVEYSFKSADKWRIISGRLVLERRADGIEVILEDIALNESAKRESVSGRLEYNGRPDDSNPRSKSGKYMPGLLQELFIKAFEKIEPPVFSGVKWMRKFNIIPSTDGRVRIEGTKIIVTNPRATTRIPVTYSDNFKVEDRSVPITITAELFVDKKIKLATGTQEYDVGINFEGVTTTPDSLKSKLDLKKERYRTFSTGESDNSTPLSEKGETVAAFLQTVFEKLLRGVSDETSDGGISYDRDGRPKPYDSAKIPDAFKIKRLWEALAQNPPVKAHCVARAAQLLNVAAIRDTSTGEGYSSVCRVKFPYINNGSLPEPGRSITSEDGIYAMAMLFVDTLGRVDFMPKVTDTADFAKFRQQLRYSFERYQSLEDTPKTDKLNDITEMQMPFCQGHSSDRIKVNGALLQTLRRKADDLIRRQTVHTAGVMRLIFKLFDEREVRAGSLAINPNIMIGGMEAINRLSDEARTLLITYYGDCEQTYKEGLFALYEQKNTLQFQQRDTAPSR
jgi:hypothetical protein